MIGSPGEVEIRSHLPRYNGFVNRFNLLLYVVDYNAYSGVHLHRVRRREGRWNQPLTTTLHHLCRMQYTFEVLTFLCSGNAYDRYERLTALKVISSAALPVSCFHSANSVA